MRAVASLLSYFLAKNLSDIHYYVATYVRTSTCTVACDCAAAKKIPVVWCRRFLPITTRSSSSSSFDTLKSAARPQTTIVPTVHKWTFNQRNMGTETMWTWEKEEGVQTKKRNS